MDKRVAILGSTGSIGCQTLEVIAETPGLRACAIGARDNWKLLAEQAAACKPDVVAIVNPDHAAELSKHLDKSVKLIAGPDALSELIRESKPNVVLTAVVGSAGLKPTMTAIEIGATLALANKETLVCAGSVVVPAARAAGVDILPVDSEHSGIFQCLAAGTCKEVRKITITSSGGSLRDMSDAEANAATVKEALSHPTWEMGPKITIDSATLMNKTLEMIEAHWLFDLPPEKIDVVIHPQSIIHAMVEFCDGSVIAQLAEPDMKGPIAYALSYPDRPTRNVKSLDLAAIGKLEFRAVQGRFARAIELGHHVIRDGGAAGSVVNAANEAAVEAFLNDKITFGRILPIIDSVLDIWDNSQTSSNSPTLSTDKQVTLQDLLTVDEWARKQVADLL
ncbi:MAG: 1-deoxy-D-xylulose-5-phosphate reductoisomerase [Phycisphaerae bacterium]|nr:1-deoxy-D-xylulose-5-phosphate reductoisomerase [Phycisphaerae bacterium]